MSESDDELLVPTSDPYEEVLFPGYSQRDETRERVEDLVAEQLKHSQAKEVHRVLLAAGRTESTRYCLDRSTSASSPAGSRTPKSSQKHPNRDINLLLLHCQELEQERDKALEKCRHLQNEHDKTSEQLRQCKLALTFFQKETGRWRWAAANAHTRMQSAVRDFQTTLGTLATVSDKLRNPRQS
ncbi:hypothetical protein B0H13DRAFT_1913007 [Mycena leptocephala]|nr:hypothetical protein B0H13DRAFT_1913007 [Mycena leptocephala]